MRRVVDCLIWASVVMLLALVAVTVLPPLGARVLPASSPAVQYTSSSNDLMQRVSTLAAAFGALAALLAVVEMRKDRAERSRPYVVLGFEPAQGDLMRWRLRNTGLGPAGNVRVSFGELPADMLPKLNELPIFQHPIAALGPGSDVAGEFALLLTHASELVPCAVTVQYWDETGKPYKEDFTVDLAQFASVYTSRETIHGQLKLLNNTLGKLVEGMPKRR